MGAPTDTDFKNSQVCFFKHQAGGIADVLPMAISLGLWSTSRRVEGYQCEDNACSISVGEVEA